MEFFELNWFNQPHFYHCMGPGILVAAAGMYFRLFPPKDNNTLLAYRSEASLKDQDTWQESHRFLGELLLTLGAADMAAGFLAFRFLQEEYQMVLMLFVFAGQSGFIAPSVENHLRKVFSERFHDH